MSTKYTGGFITKSPVAPTTTAASGIWTLDQQQQAQKAGTWPSPPIFIEDIFSTFLYTGNGGAQTITNSVDLSGNGGLVWLKGRSSGNHILQDTDRGANNYLMTDSTAATQTLPGTNFVFGSSGFSMNNSYLGWNTNTNPYASWTFRQQSKFFDVVTYTGNGSGAGQTISHNLGATPGFIICKCVSAVQDWAVCARTGGAASPESAITYATGLSLNTTAAASYSGALGSFPTSTTFNTAGLFTSPGAYPNLNGETYVAYLFAHDAGGFPVSGGGSTNGISCGSFTTTGTNPGTVVNLGYEPQWVMVKRTNGADGWYMFDNMRGLTANVPPSASYLFANTTGAEVANSAYAVTLTSTGFNVPGTSNLNENGYAYIYIAIRRGPMKTPTVGTSVFTPVAYTGNGSTRTYPVGFPTDLSINMNRNGAGDSPTWNDRLRGTGIDLYSNSTSAEANNGSIGVQFDNQTNIVVPTYRISNGTPYIDWCMRRAPGFFDEVCFTTPSSGTITVTHNLGVTPQLVITKLRSGTSQFWIVNSDLIGSTNYLVLDTTANSTSAGSLACTPSSTTVTFSAGYLNASSQYVQYLFATCAGISKVGSYTGTGATQTIDCGFTGGARFVLVKRTDSTGDWYVWDTARGMVSGTDPSLQLNSAAAEVNVNSIYTASTGFQIVSIAAAINASGGTYLFLAIA